MLQPLTRVGAQAPPYTRRDHLVLHRVLALQGLCRKPSGGVPQLIQVSAGFARRVHVLRHADF